jgi:hypothetical protein
MQFPAALLPSNWSEPLGWTLIAGALSLAVQTLAGRHRARPTNAIFWVPRRSAAARPVDPDKAWQKLAEIVEDSFVRAEMLHDTQARAIEAVAAAEEVALPLLADCSAVVTMREAAPAQEDPERARPTVLEREPASWARAA